MATWQLALGNLALGNLATLGYGHGVVSIILLYLKSPLWAGLF